MSSNTTLRLYLLLHAQSSVQRSLGEYGSSTLSADTGTTIMADDATSPIKKGTYI